MKVGLFSVLYVAYGSNMNVAQMRKRCPGARLLGRGILAGYQLSFRGRPGNCHATIDECEGGRVPVVLWRITSADEAALDRYEGYPSYYRKERVLVGFDGQVVLGMAYVMNGCEIGEPSATYFGTILQGYRDAGIDAAPLVAALQRAQKHNDERRANV